MAGSALRLLSRLVLALGLLLAVALPSAPVPAADALAAATSAATDAKAPPVLDRNLMVFGCMGGLMVGTLSVVLPPVAAWTAAGVWMGGLGTMIVRAGLGCVYGGLAGAVASAARSVYRWIDETWRAWTGRPANRPLPFEGAAGS